MIDSNSPLTEGVDVSGVPRKLGDTDDMGVTVGYIDHDGTCWESSRERDEAIVSARYFEAWLEWNACGGVQRRPNVVQFAMRFCNHAENIAAAISAARRDTDLRDPFLRAQLRRMGLTAVWN